MSETLSLGGSGHRNNNNKKKRPERPTAFSTEQPSAWLMTAWWAVNHPDEWTIAGRSEDA